MPDNYEVYYMGTSDSPMFLEQWLQSLLDDNRELVCFSEGWWVFRKIYQLTVPKNEGCAEVHLDCKIAQLEAELARRDEIITRLKEALPTFKRDHYYCEDCWYSCPKEEDGCCDDGAGEDCNCGADEWNARIDLLMKELE